MPFAIPASSHVPVMVDQVVQTLMTSPVGDYVDVTFGGGGHARAILAQLEGGRLFAFDQDPMAQEASRSLKDHPNFTFIPASFRFIREFLDFYGVHQLAGLCADLGTCSDQIDRAERGFSFRFDGPLDMRMDPTRSCSAREVVNQYTALQLTRMFRAYGELPEAATLAALIVKARAKAPIATTHALRDLLQPLAPKHKANQYLAKVFQAIRIQVNDELQALEELLHHSVALIQPGGRLVVMAYHSLEDRLVKNFFNTGNTAGLLHKDGYGNLLRPFVPLHKKPYMPTDQEIHTNNRARSARMRVAVRVPFV